MKTLAILLTAAGLVSSLTGSKAIEPASQTFLLVLDGLRPDYVTTELMPNLEAWSRKGVICRNHHSVFPTVTRVNATSIATGAYPGRHGLLGNSVFFPSLSPTQGLSTGGREKLIRIEENTGGQLLTVPSLGEYLSSQGKRLLAVSSGSSGSATLLNHKGCGEGIIHPEFVLPESRRAAVLQAVGEPSEEALPNKALNHWAVDACLKFGFGESHPEVVILWISDPDHTAHVAGIGSPLATEALHSVDEEFGRMLSTLDGRGMLDEVNILVTSDHGFSTHTGRKDLAAWLIANGLKSGPKSEDVVVVEGGIYVQDHDQEKVRKTVELLQRTDWIGAIFTQARTSGNPEGGIPGTLSLDLVQWNHARSADILVSENWSDELNENGWPGMSTQQGVAGHGTSSLYDIHNTLIAGGPAFKSGVVSEIPTGNVDLSPTLCRLTGLDPSPTMQGRSLNELLKEGPGSSSHTVEKQTHSVTGERAKYHLILQESRVGEARYVDFTRVERK